MFCSKKHGDYFSRLLIPVVMFALLITVDNSYAIEDVKIGVLSYRGKEEAVKQWSATAQYLTEKIPGYQFEIVALNLPGIVHVVENELIDFTLTNPGNYVELESNFGISRIVTMLSKNYGISSTRFGAVIISRADNSEIKNLNDLKGHSFMAVSPNAFGGFQMAWRELAENGIDPYKDFSRLEFVGFPQDQSPLAVYDGEVDAATVRSETLVRMIDSGLFSLDDFTILNRQQSANPKIPLSTRLYPEWPFAKNANTSRELAKKVTMALLAMPEMHLAATSSHTAGWTVPLDYSSVHTLMRTLKIGPYIALRETTLKSFISRYKAWILLSVLVIISLMIMSIYITRTNRILKESDTILRNEIAERKQSENKLDNYKNTLELRVESRTSELEKANRDLQKSQYALHNLVDITSQPNLSHEEKLHQLLETGRDYYALPIAILSTLDDRAPQTCIISGDRSLLADTIGPLSQQCVQILEEHQDQPLDIPDLDNYRKNNVVCGREGLKSYLASAVFVKGKPYCILEFADIKKRDSRYSHWDHNLLQVMAQWIGNELEKQAAIEEKQGGQYELARVARASSMGEMAAGLAHEINQPLTGAINYSSGCLRRIEQGDFNIEKLKQGLEKTVEGATLAADIIRQLRKFLQRGDDHQCCASLNDVVLNITDLISTDIKRHNVELILKLDKNIPDVTMNKVQIEQVILNLIRNGLDAMDNDSLINRQLTVATKKVEGFVMLSVMDTGSGIEASTDTKLFEPFYTTKEEGMGIGLSISRTIIEAHNGIIGGENLDTEGAHFFFRIPLGGCA